jgi:hypothetical protein
LAAYIAHELRLRLGHRRIIVNREVVVRPTNAGDAGERPDILVEATNPRDDLGESPTITVPSEIKGAWHPEVHTAQESQLVARYLPDTKTTAGIYLVGWFPLEQWNAQDNRTAKARSHGSADALRLLLEAQSETIKQAGRTTYPIPVHPGHIAAGGSWLTRTRGGDAHHAH